VLVDLTKSRAAAAYAALSEFERLAALIPAAPSLADRMALADQLSQRHRQYRDLLEELEDGRDPEPGMAQAAPAVDEARRRVEPGDWWEGLAAVALCAPLSDELFGALPAGAAAVPDEPNDTTAADAVPDTASDTGSDTGSDTASDVAVHWASERLRAAIEADPVLAARIALWGRRLVGETIVLAREFGGERYSELADLLAANHLQRLTGLGVSG
jgi:hypothetical protein